ncbi:unnamed protein product [Oikopleura dioica]|uniref:Peptidase M14 domain-containing protein n=1 Tax=Oikopleura dioica TaxID=34765 RepID=E4XRZ3_OIKDI|nr:unnamed protein product [Oikopleura dioica]
MSFSDLENGFVLRQEEIGRSYENRAMKGFSLRNPAKSLPWIVIDCGIHSREFISHATCRNLLINLAECAANDASCSGDFESFYEFNWYIMPNLNPDGYEYNWTTDRMWRKNRTPTEGSICIGVDLNRNSDVAWATVGASDNPCSNTYYGTAPFGEPEMAAWNSTIGTIHEQGEIEVYISFHAYAQKLLSSWAVDFSIIPDEPPTLAELQAAGAAATQAMTAAHGKTYLYGQSRDSLYPSSGTSKDYAMDVLKVPLSWTWELRDTGDYGFLLPSDQIMPVWDEVRAGLIEVAKYAITKRNNDE